MLADHEMDLRLFARTVREMGAKPVAVNLPFPHLWTNAEPGLRGQVLANILDAFQRGQMPILDLSFIEERFPEGDFEVSSMDAHPKSEVHEAIADAVEPWLRKQF